MKLLILFLLIGCGQKIKVQDSTHTVKHEIPNTLHRVDVVASMDFTTVDAFFQILCEQKLQDIEGIDLDKETEACLNENKFEFIKHLTKPKKEK